MKRVLALFVILLSMSPLASATAQIPETLILDGTARVLFTNPLDPWLREHGNADKLLSYISEQRCSASWRGYAGNWEIINDQLVLVKLRVNPCGQNSTDVLLSALFPRQTVPIVATWFSGRLTVPDGKQTEYVHMGYMSKYERYILFQIERGKIISRQIVTELPESSSEPKPFVGMDAPPPPRIVP